MTMEFNERYSCTTWQLSWFYQVHIPRLRGSSHYAAQVERSLPKLLLRGEGRSPLKYIMSVLLSNFEYFIENKFHLSTKVWISILDGLKLLPKGQTLDIKSAKKYCHVCTLETFHLWGLATSVKAQRSTSCFSPIKLLDFLHLSIDQRSVKTPLELLLISI